MTDREHMHVKRQVTNWKNVFAAHLIEKELIFPTYKELLDIEKKKKNTSIGKWLKDMNKLLTETEIQIALKYIKDAQPHS